jgi:hypothetical protein
MLNNKVLYKKFFDWAIMGGGMIVLRSLKTKGDIFQARPKKFSFKNHI